MALFAQECSDQPAKPGLVRRHHIYPRQKRLSVSGGHHGLGDPQGAVLAASCGAMKVIGNADRQETGRWKNNRAGNSHPLPGCGLFASHEKGPFRRRERAMQRFRSMRSLQKFVAVHASVHNHFNQERHLYSRSNFKLNRTAALAEWRQLGTP